MLILGLMIITVPLLTMSIKNYNLCIYFIIVILLIYNALSLIHIHIITGIRNIYDVLMSIYIDVCKWCLKYLF